MILLFFFSSLFFSFSFVRFSVSFFSHLLWLLLFFSIFCCSIASFVTQPNVLMLTQMLLNSFYVCMCLCLCLHFACVWALYLLNIAHFISFLTMSMAFLLCVHAFHSQPHIMRVYECRYPFARFVCCKCRMPIVGKLGCSHPVGTILDHYNDWIINVLNVNENTERITG